MNGGKDKDKEKDEGGIDPKDYAALSGFLRGYLHQDARLVHGSPAEAARAFRRDADERRAAVVRAEMDRLLSATRQLPFARLEEILERELGSAWRFRDRQEVEQLRDALR